MPAEDSHQESCGIHRVPLDPVLHESCQIEKKGNLLLDNELLSRSLADTRADIATAKARQKVK
jgi:hypothetical protein